MADVEQLDDVSRIGYDSSVDVDSPSPPPPPLPSPPSSPPPPLVPEHPAGPRAEPPIVHCACETKTVRCSVCTALDLGLLYQTHLAALLAEMDALRAAHERLYSRAHALMTGLDGAYIVRTGAYTTETEEPVEAPQPMTRDQLQTAVRSMIRAQIIPTPSLATPTPQGKRGRRRRRRR